MSNETDLKLDPNHQATLSHLELREGLKQSKLGILASSTRGPAHTLLTNKALTKINKKQRVFKGVGPLSSPWGILVYETVVNEVCPLK